jgi:hypothetical protein
MTTKPAGQELPSSLPHPIRGGPELILTGFVRTDSGPEEFAVYRHCNQGPAASPCFTCVDHKFAEHGWVTLNASGGLPAYAAQHGVYFETAAACASESEPGTAFPFDELSHASDVTDVAYCGDRE